MKYLTLFLLLIFFLIGSSYTKAQSFKIECTYRMEHLVDSNNPSSKKTEDMLLLLNDDSSVFKSKNYFFVDSFYSRPVDNTKIKTVGEQHPTSYRFVIIKDKSEQVIFSDFIDIDLYEYKEPRSNFKWEIFADTTTIEGFHCQKATTFYGGRKWTAWFTNEIPRSDGPYKFCGLPGLIIKISDNQNYFNFTLTGITNRSGYIFSAYGAGSKSQKEEFNRSLNYYRENRFEVMTMSKKMVFHDERSRAAVKKNMETKYRTENIQIER